MLSSSSSFSFSFYLFPLHRVLPVTLDVGTDNAKLLKDPHYVGIQEPRLQGDEYYDMIDEFMVAVFAKWPGVVVQFEDFETSKAVPLLAKYKDKYRLGGKV
jgi:malate dehydrogenase (decarboxylating)